jgi:hypothetical protein
MLSRLTLLWSCLALLGAACSLDSSPRAKGRSDKADGGAWQPLGAGGSGRRVNSETEDSADASKTDAQAARDAAAPAPARGSSAKDGGTAQPSAPADSSQDPSTPAPSTPTAGDDAQPPSAPAAGTGGVAGDQAQVAAGSAGAAGSGGENSRQSLIDAAIEALGGGEYPWRGGGSDGDGLSADFVKSVLFSLVAQGTCFRDRQRCFQTCFVIASDCEACAADAECADALKRVCGPLGECSP